MLDEPPPSRSTTTSHRKALLVNFCPVSLSVDRVELLRSMALGGSGGGSGEVGRDLARLTGLEEGCVGMTPMVCKTLVSSDEYVVIN